MVDLWQLRSVNNFRINKDQEIFEIWTKQQLGQILLKHWIFICDFGVYLLCILVALTAHLRF